MLKLVLINQFIFKQGDFYFNSKYVIADLNAFSKIFKLLIESNDESNNLSAIQKVIANDIPVWKKENFIKKLKEICQESNAIIMLEFFLDLNLVIEFKHDKTTYIIPLFMLNEKPSALVNLIAIKKYKIGI